MNERTVRIYTHIYRYSGVTEGSAITELSLYPLTGAKDIIGKDDGGVEYILPDDYILYTDPVANITTIRTKVANIACHLLPFGNTQKPALIDPTKGNGFVIWLKRVGESEEEAV